MAHNDSAEASGQEGHDCDAFQHQQSMHSVTSQEVLRTGMQWLQSAYRGWAAKLDITVLPVLPAAPESLDAIRSLLSGVRETACPYKALLQCTLA